MLLKPSEIYYCQNSVKNKFSNGNRIGETLDDLCEGRCLLSSFPRIRVSKRDSKWFTTDNRRLWVFRHLYRLGKCGEIPVIETGDIPSQKMTTDNGGTSISVRGAGGPGGTWYLKPNGTGSNPDGTFSCTWPESSFYSIGSFYSDSDDDVDSDDYGFDDLDDEYEYDSDFTVA
ncbi:uncharacterized protein LOC128550626 [Mercenaria mercenaria]|uniref:uncharacterized protein LOC128550626 n=1 Tax=Mercenaria mercenaria TaxID=6596 RepID=UPI00234F3648|nr:uncharacterized protein LOC128550626 [Mercenaria mercenaria]